jgi:ankyrin repeat protein
MSADLAKPLFHHHLSFSRFVPENCRRNEAGTRQTLQLVECDTVDRLKKSKISSSSRPMKPQELFDAIRTKGAAEVAALLDDDAALLDARLIGISPILFAVYNGHPELAQLFIDRGARLTFCEACALGDAQRAMPMLDDDPALLETYSEDGFPPLGLAIFFGHPELARTLIERGADVNAAARNALLVAPVHAAAAARDARTMHLLLARGADVNARQQFGSTALHTAAQHGDEAIVDLLLASGADPSVANDSGKTPVALAAAYKHPAIEKRLS